MTNINKKDYVLKALQTLQPYWPIAEDLMKLVDSGALTTDMINSIQQILAKTIAGLVEGSKKEKFQEALAELDKIKAMEEQVRQQEKKELSDLESKIEEVVGE